MSRFEEMQGLVREFSQDCLPLVNGGSIVCTGEGFQFLRWEYTYENWTLGTRFSERQSHPVEIDQGRSANPVKTITD